MTGARASELFPMADTASNFFRSTGVWPSQLLRAAVNQGHEVQSAAPIDDDQIQPASLDLRLGEVAYRVRASFLPGGRARVRDKLDLLSMHRIDLGAGAVLEKDCVYIVPLLEYVALRHRTSAFANPKSSIGRLDVFARGPANDLIHKWYGASGWSGWESLGGVLADGPGVSSWAARANAPSR